jgi:hypoxanthine phosphoribosyltransferase
MESPLPIKVNKEVFFDLQSTFPKVFPRDIYLSIYMKLLYSESQIKQEVDRVASEIVDHYQGKQLLIVGILTGAYIFKADLVRAIYRRAKEKNVEVTLEDDFTTASSYFHGRKSGSLRIVYDLNIDPKDKDILVVDDIWDTGNTSRYVRDYYLFRKAKSVEIAVFIHRVLNDSLSADQKDQKLEEGPKYTCFNHEGKDFFVGYGLDDKGIKREIPEVYGLEAHEI